MQHRQAAHEKAAFAAPDRVPKSVEINNPMCEIVIIENAQGNRRCGSFHTFSLLLPLDWRLIILEATNKKEEEEREDTFTRLNSSAICR